MANRLVFGFLILGFGLIAAGIIVGGTSGSILSNLIHFSSESGTGLESGLFETVALIVFGFVFVVIGVILVFIGGGNLIRQSS